MKSAIIAPTSSHFPAPTGHPNARQQTRLSILAARPTSTQARTDMKVLAHIREQYSLRLGTYGRLRMTMELKEAGIDVGERRIGRLMRINSIKPVRIRGQGGII